MREILFRGKTVQNKWIEGDLYRSRLKSTFMISYYTQYGNRMTEHVKTETVGQYTGLTDKNGTKIFEGDIVSTDITRPYLIVEFRDGCFMFNCNDGGEDYYDIMLPICKEAHTVYEYGEVIGNIHDNPELMKGGDG